MCGKKKTGNSAEATWEPPFLWGPVEVTVANSVSDAKWSVEQEPAGSFDPKETLALAATKMIGLSGTLGRG